ncbi:hypothetical protein MESS4_830173 [Mesorhizobium sp. STM 4661]|nr:hypothetical protein MESS4_830173 [Mesorhizobium sp. STM 4661]
MRRARPAERVITERGSVFAIHEVPRYQEGTY